MLYKIWQETMIRVLICNIQINEYAKTSHQSLSSRNLGGEPTEKSRCKQTTCPQTEVFLLKDMRTKVANFLLWFLTQVHSLYKGAIFFLSSRVLTNQNNAVTSSKLIIPSNGNVYNSNFLLLTFAKRKYNGSPKNSCSKTRFTSLFT